VTEIALDAAALGQFDDSKILAAAELLADAKVDVIGWSGTSSGWLGFDRDLQLTERIRERTGIPATTAVLALNELLAIRQVKRLAFVTPYTQDVQERIVANYRALGIEVVAEEHLGIRWAPDFAGVSPHPARADGAGGAPAAQAITTFCTNLRAWPRVERHLGIPLLDTVSTSLGHGRAAGQSPAAITGWGSCSVDEPPAEEADQNRRPPPPLARLLRPAQSPPAQAPSNRVEHEKSVDEIGGSTSPSWSTACTRAPSWARKSWPTSSASAAAVREVHAAGTQVVEFRAGRLCSQAHIEQARRVRGPPPGRTSGAAPPGGPR
jgi:maleate isomerase